ncbi:acyltransferase family protein [Massilia alkalitolerans]|uniref:acyltransferase family protein n=1 Tax=Massilia alkalitolerans TaxID=286638 RepID=UPI0028A66C78|nr:acyltransferase [Massilia alkalitolerans]
MKLNQLAGLRGICAWWVVFFHSLELMQASIPRPVARFLSEGYLAVDLFFLLSGFVIFLSYHASLMKNFPQSVGKFYWNRFARIYPLHVVMLGGYLLLFAAFHFFSSSGSAPASYTWSAFFQSLFLVHMWVGSDLTWNVPSWSISSEWFVYLFFPLMAYGLRKMRGGVPVHLLTIAAAALLLYLIYTASGTASLGADIPRMALVRTLLEFLMGVLIGSLYVNHKDFLEKYRNLSLAGFVVLCTLYAGTSLADYTIIPVAFAFLIAYLSVTSSWITRTLSHPWLVYLGEISYSTYMVHYLIYDLLKAGFVARDGSVNPVYVWLSFVVVFLLSVALHHAVDSPSQHYFRRLSTRKATERGSVVLIDGKN